MHKVIIGLLWIISPAHAELYKIVDSDGKITFTDTPPEIGAVAHTLGAINSISNPMFNMGKLNLTIPYVDDDGSMIVQGAVNGIAMRFIVDTGATLLAIPSEIAKQAGLLEQPSQAVTAQTANGSIQVSKVMIKNLMVSKINTSQIEATIQDISPSDPKLGLLGMSFFNKYKMTIDHLEKVIQLEEK